VSFELALCAALLAVSLPSWAAKKVDLDFVQVAAGVLVEPSKVLSTPLLQ